MTHLALESNGSYVPIQVHNMDRLYIHSEDIDREASYDAHESDKLAFKVISRTDAALKASKQLDPTAKETLVRLLDVMLATHRTIRMLFKNKGDNGRHRPAGLSLVREQVEVVFVAVLIASEPAKRSRQYHRAAWADGWVDLLAERQQCQHLPAFADFVKSTGPQWLESIRRASDITEAERDELSIAFEDWLAGKRRRPIPGKWRFPTPGDVMKLNGLSDRAKRLLKSWDVQYQIFCRYAHVRGEKLTMFEFETHKLRLSVTALDSFIQNKYANACCMSWLAIGSVCTEIMVLLDKPDEQLEALDEYWQLFSKMTFLGRELWDTSVSEVIQPR